MKRKKLHIALVTVADLPEGWGRTGRLRTLISALTGLGHQVTVWNQHSLEAAGTTQVAGEMCGARYEYVLGTTDRERGFKAIGLKLRAVKEILKRVRHAAAKGELDLVIFNHLAFYDTFPITRLARRLGVPTVQCYEDERMELVVKHNISLSQRIFGWNSWAADHWCSRMADQIWVISSYLQEKYAALSGHAERVHIVPTIIDCNAWAMPPEPRNTPPVILYSGGFGEHEDIEKLTAALGILKQRGIPFQMRFVGANPNLPRVQKLQSDVRELKLESSVTLRGFSPSSVVKEEVANANILMNLRTNSVWSKSGLSTKLSEYLAAGRTVMTTDIGDNARYVQDGVSALVVSPDDPADRVADLLAKALQDPNLRTYLAAGAREAALRHFDVPVVQDHLSHLLERMTRR